MENPRRLFETVYECPDFTPSLDILRVKGNEEFTLVLVDERIEWVHLHWNGNHECRHVPEPDMCECKEKLWRSIWKGFIAYTDLTKGMPVKLLQVTQIAGKDFERRMSGQSMRGTWVQVKRRHGHKFSPLMITTMERDKQLLLPASPDKTATFYNLWGPHAGKKKS